MKKITIATDWLWEILVLHFNWVLYVFRGAIVLGVFPATAAVYAVTRHWLQKGNEEKISLIFKKYYKENFKIANLLGWIISFFSLMIYYNWAIIPDLTQPAIKIPMYGILVVFTVLTVLAWIYLFPVIVHYRLTWFNYLIVGIRVGLSYFSYTILQAALIGVCLVIFWKFVPLVVIFGVSLFGVIQMYICNHIFGQLNPQEKHA